MHMRTRSQLAYEKLCEVIPGGVNSPARAFKGLQQSPMVAERGAADRIYDVDGNEYLDFCGSWGALIHGHAHQGVLQAVHKRIDHGTTYGITTEIEERLARKIVQCMPSIEKIRFVSTGTEATMSAIRLARGYTKRPLIVKFTGNFHGHADFLLVQAGSGVHGLTPTSSSDGVPAEIVKHTVCLPYNDPEAFQQFLKELKDPHQLAAVIVEPIAANMGVVEASPEFLQCLRRETEKVGAVLIFDEVVSGFRVGLQGAQGKYGITPDLTCLGKIIGGGFPAAAFGGRAEIMDCLAPLGTVYQSGTLSGNPVAMEAGWQTIRLLEEPGCYEELERKTNLLTEPLRRFFVERNIPACVQQSGSMFTIFFGRTSVGSMEEASTCDTTTFGAFFRHLFQRGIYIPPSQFEAWFVSTAHTDEHLIKARECIIGYFN